MYLVIGLYEYVEFVCVEVVWYWEVGGVCVVVDVVEFVFVFDVLFGYY